MENEKEITKLVNVLSQIKHSGRDAESAEFCLQQYNKIVERISELEPSIKNLFTPLPEKTSPKTLHFAVSELIAYLTDEKETSPEDWRGHRRRVFCRKKGIGLIFAYNPRRERC